MWEVAAELGSQPGFLCWPGVTLLSLLSSFPPPHPTPLPAQSPGSGKTGRLGRWACSLFCPLVAIKSYGNSIRALDTTGPLSAHGDHHHPTHRYRHLQGHKYTQGHRHPQNHKNAQDWEPIGSLTVTEPHPSTGLWAPTRWAPTGLGYRLRQLWL